MSRENVTIGDGTVVRCRLFPDQAGALEAAVLGDHA
jgi:hypothetical protein